MPNIKHNQIIYQFGGRITPPENHVSKKKKNTYQIVFSDFMPAHLFEHNDSTPLGVIEKNGKKTDIKTLWLHSIDFPNPCASYTAQKQEILREIMGYKLSTQIIEYLDKETGKPVLQIYPETVHIFDEYKNDYMSHLNHASRRDIKWQIALRQRLRNKFMTR